MYPAMSSRIGNEKCELTFSLVIVTMLNVYRIVLKHRIFGRRLKHALQPETRGEEAGNTW